MTIPIVFPANQKQSFKQVRDRPLMAYTGRLRSKGVPFFRLLVYERAGISLVELYRRVEKSVIWVCERAQKGQQMNLMALLSQKTFYFCY